jgi:uncharacterized protein YcnI
VRPAEVAPGDAVLWEVLVPSEEEGGTKQVELQVPKDVLPFSFEDTPGWQRTLKTGSDGSTTSIVWKGRTRPDGLATFRFLASAPEQEGPIEWKALQTYKDGHVVRWIGDEGTENPASTTIVSKSVPKQNAGGEGEAAEDSGDNLANPGLAAEVPAEDDGPDWVARGVGLAALLAALAAAGIALRRRA